MLLYRKLGFWLFFAVPVTTAAAFVGCGSSSDGTSDDTTDAATADTSLVDGGSDSDAGQPSDSGQKDVATIEAGPCANGKTYVDLDGGTHPVPAAQTFGANMTGCPGTVYFDDRASLCGASCSPCTAAQWVAMHGTTKPAYNFWTNDNLNYSGEFDPGLECFATPHAIQDADAGIPYVEACEPGELDLDDGGTQIVTSPMRVCYSNDSDPFGDQFDPLGNECNWTRCALGLGDEIIDAGPDADPDAAPPSFDSLGGCDGNITAGTLCCCP